LHSWDSVHWNLISHRSTKGFQLAVFQSFKIETDFPAQSQRTGRGRPGIDSAATGSLAFLAR
jgi:hypothetical protein